MRWSLQCTVCDKGFPKDYRGFRCECGGPLDLRFEADFTQADLLASQSLWRYRPALPVERDDALVTLGEGMTPIVEESTGGGTVHLKLEYLAPTGSFKDRGAAVLMSRLKEMGIEEILEDSSGNAGCSIAAYSAAAGIHCRVLVPAGIPEGKAAQIAAYGAALERIQGSRDDVAEEALRRSARVFYASHNWQPFFLQGTKTFAYEVYEQMSPLPDTIFFPVGNGSLLSGCFKGFEEMRTLGWIDRIPRLVGVQAVSHPPIYMETTGRKLPPARTQTIAGGIAIQKPARLGGVVRAIRESNGTAVVVDDDQIRKAQKWLARKGYLVEPTAAAAVAGYEMWRGMSDGDEASVLVPLTGLGLKDMASLVELAGS